MLYLPRPSNYESPSSSAAVVLLPDSLETTFLKTRTVVGNIKPLLSDAKDQVLLCLWTCQESVFQEFGCNLM